MFKGSMTNCAVQNKHLEQHETRTKHQDVADILG